MTGIIDNNTGYCFPPPARIGGFIFILIGLLFTFGNPFIGLLVMLIGGYPAVTSTGVIVDNEKNRYKEYTRYFGIKKGPWKSLDSYPYLAVLGSRQSSTTYSSSNRSTTSRKKVYNVCLLNKTHRKKILIKELKDKEEALKYAKAISSKIGVEYTSYNPVVSSRTKSRRTSQ